MGKSARKGDATRLADFAPIMITSQSSMESVCDNLINSVDEKLSIDRFRGNIIIGGSPAWIEDRLRKIRIGKAIIRIIMRAPRCTMPTVNQQTGEAGFRKGIKTAEPLATLKKFRRFGLRNGWTGLLPVSDGGVGGGVSPCFGLYCACDKEAVVKKGDDVVVLEYATPTFVEKFVDACLWLFTPF
eukprot:TRINITY_DN13306_c0_g1_i1.p1 TRINITY_DN13306_c0_g1~~TRINITY_DN13306_c0_g1_i1.p1  ORF type:complete len:185 (+),score=23.34 TRINITY_DN13306_c0_g1_i1:493-1047(+)